MRSRIILGIIGSIFSLYSMLWAADWKNVVKDRAGNQWLYDLTGITHPSEGIVRVWAKTIFSEKGKESLIKVRGRRFQDLSHCRTLRKYNCGEKKAITLAEIDYSKEGKVLDMDTFLTSDWSDVIPGTFEELMLKATCK